MLRPPAASSAAMGAGVLFGSSLVLLPVMLITGQGWFPQAFDDGAIATLIAIAINAAFLVLFFEIIRRAGPTFFAQFNYLAVLAGVAWGAIVFGERLTLTFFLAMVLMFAASSSRDTGAKQPRLATPIEQNGFEPTLLLCPPILRLCHRLCAVGLSAR